MRGKEVVGGVLIALGLVVVGVVSLTAKLMTEMLKGGGGGHAKKSHGGGGHGHH
jgi:hypothetical protein